MITVLGLPFDENSSYLTGAAKAPEAIREIWNSGSSNNFSENLVDVSEGKEWTDGGCLKKGKQSTEAYFESISKYVSQIYEKKSKVLCLGGDHSLTFPIVRGLAASFTPCHIVHIDAHPDLYADFEGNRFSHASPFARILENNLALSLTQIGIRTLNQHQKNQADLYNVKQFTSTSWALGDIKKLSGPLYLSVDIDALDPAFAPGVAHHEPGGLTTRELVQIIQAIDVQIIGADIVELNPKRDINNMTATVAFKIMKELLAKMSR